MLPKCSLTEYIYICINAFDYNAIIVYFTVLKPGTLYETWYYPSYHNCPKFDYVFHMLINVWKTPRGNPMIANQVCLYLV